MINTNKKEDNEKGSPMRALKNSVPTFIKKTAMAVICTASMLTSALPNSYAANRLAFTDSAIRRGRGILKTNMKGASFSTSSSRTLKVAKNGTVTPYRTGKVTVYARKGRQRASMALYITSHYLNGKRKLMVWRERTSGSTKYLEALNTVYGTKGIFGTRDFTNYTIKMRSDKYDQNLYGITPYSHSQRLYSSKAYKLFVINNKGHWWSVSRALKDIVISNKYTYKNVYTACPNLNGHQYMDYLLGRYSAHRGLTSETIPENSYASYYAAGKTSVRWGYWPLRAIESDVHDTKDGKLVMIHNNSLVGTTNISKSDKNYKKTIGMMTYKEIRRYNLLNSSGAVTGEKIPTLDTYLSTCKKYGKVPTLEIKDFYSVDNLKKVLQKIRKYNLQNKTIIFSFREGLIENLDYLDSKKNPIRKLVIYKNPAYWIAGDKNANMYFYKGFYLDRGRRPQPTAAGRG